MRFGLSPASRGSKRLTRHMFPGRFGKRGCHFKSLFFRMLGFATARELTMGDDSTYETNSPAAKSVSLWLRQKSNYASIQCKQTTFRRHSETSRWETQEEISNHPVSVCLLENQRTTEDVLSRLQKQKMTKEPPHRYHHLLPFSNYQHAHVQRTSRTHASESIREHRGASSRRRGRR